MAGEGDGGPQNRLKSKVGKLKSYFIHESCFWTQTKESSVYLRADSSSRTHTRPWQHEQCSGQIYTLPLYFLDKQLNLENSHNFGQSFYTFFMVSCQTGFRRSEADLRSWKLRFVTSVPKLSERRAKHASNLCDKKHQKLGCHLLQLLKNSNQSTAEFLNLKVWINFL